ncbi:restriction endonuclease subunit S [Aeromonas allosaccharophila]|uniref:restriction endonuclease subunit S n=1 Tax=Aeromonas allosaccharophila TaxID=656 RepID=UPI001117DCCE|nr:restriction endonuclease subunit S [Aeromonas allosaccharophila]
MSKLPNGWIQLALGEAIQIQKGKKPIGLGPKGKDRLIPYINISAFETKQVEEYAPEQNVPRCEESDTLLVWDGARAGLAGRGIGGFIGSTLARLTSDLAVPSYIYYFIHSNYRYLNTNTKGVGIPHINPIVLAELKFPLPPSGEQTRIIIKLEELLADLDSGVAELKAAQKKLTQYRQSLLKAAVEGTLTQEWRDSNPPKESGAQLLECILVERRARWEAKQLAKFAQRGVTPPNNWQKKYPEPIRPDITELPQLPEGWVWTSVDQLIFDSSYGTSVKCSYEGDGIPVLRIPNISRGSIDLHDIKFSTTKIAFDEKDFLTIGDVLIIRTNGSIGLVGRAAAVIDELPSQYYFASYLLRLRCTDNFSVHRWLLTALSAHSGRKWLEARAASSAGQHNISLSTLLTMPIPLPPQEEQLHALNRLDEAYDSITQQEDAILLLVKQCAAQRQNILRTAFSGQLVPQDANDEPASVLLDRIRIQRVEKAKQPKPRKTKKKESTMVTRKLVDVLTEAGDWLPAQEAFNRCGINDGAQTEVIETLYAELRQLDKANRLAVEAVADVQGRKIYDKLKLLVS